MRVVATAKGYYGHRVRRPGAVFDVEEEAYFVMQDGKKVNDENGKPRTCSWMELEGKAEVTKKPSTKPPTRLGEDGDAI